MSLQTVSFFIVFYVFLAAISSTAFAENKYALIVGVDKYTNPGISNLKGAVNDSIAIKNVLINHWGFEEKNIVHLTTPEHTTRSNILKELDRLVNKTSSGDYAFIFFAGHGTSRRDYRTQWHDMSSGTGAFLPSDSKIQDINSVIVGTRDIVPRLTQLEKKAAGVFFVTDACFSANIVRSFGRARFVDFFSELDSIVGARPNTSSAEQEIEPYPYSKVVSLSSSGNHEISIEREFNGQYRGIFSVALEVVLTQSGLFDSNQDGHLSYLEIHNAVKSLMNRKFAPHYPVLLPSSFEPVSDIVNQVSFRSRYAHGDVSFYSQAPNYETTFAVDSSSVAESEEVRFSINREQCQVLNVYGDVVASQPRHRRHCTDETINSMVEGLTRQHAWISTAAGEPLGRIGLGQHFSGSTVIEGEELELLVQPENTVYLLVLGVMSNGQVITLSPNQRNGIQKIAAQTLHQLPIATVVEPFGLDYLDIYMLAEWPDFLNNAQGDRFTIGEVDSSSWPRQLHQAIQNGGLGANRHIQQLYSVPQNKRIP